MTDEGSGSSPESDCGGSCPSPRDTRNGQEDGTSDGPVDAGRLAGRDRSSAEPHRGELDPFLIDRIRDLSLESRWAEVAPLLEQLGSPPELIVEAHLKGNCPAEAISYVERLVTAREHDEGVDVVISVLSALLITPSYGDFDAGGNFVLWLSTYFGNYLEAHGRWTRAANLWDVAGETVRAATAFENAGDLRRAASRFADSGQFQRAAELWDRVGEAQRAQGARDLAVLDEDDAW